MLDFNLADLYGVETRVLRFHIETFEHSKSSQFVMTYPTTRPGKALPYAFTEPGGVMVNGILHP